ncbi:MAG: NUDIX domain-containing protein [Gammaproteobacteria bacterium]|nr:NUDIX domain-containing protein [Gammaproteobacteria bacterium]MCW8911606.1 NUDIX domain-containing protein [Gammaproteobacteria bacterium]MCW9004280.1 NUDIX domain-containing protein [Gammaproteobacteria bacterium]MCW9055554.1 NUDIX domain-containing protein [Gammaproteobacteria bacterium]
MQSVLRPVTGVATLIIDNGHLLLGYRSKSPGKNTWQCPGGLLEAGESVFDCAIRETREETGLDINNLKFGPYTNNYFVDEGFHSVTLYVTANCAGGKLDKKEPDLAKNWAWFAKDKIPEPLFLPLQILVEEQPAFWQQLF